MADTEQQAMTSERLAELTRKHDAAIDALWESAEDVYRDDYMDARSLWFELRAEVERLRAREAALSAVVRAVANGTTPTRHANYLIFGVLTGVELRQQARALLASEQEGGGDGG